MSCSGEHIHIQRKSHLDCSEYHAIRKKGEATASTPKQKRKKKKKKNPFLLNIPYRR